MFNNFFSNAQEPRDTLLGRFFLKGMNLGHDAHSKWGLSKADISRARHWLDVGCGGGRNIRHVLNTATASKVCGIDYAKASVEMTKKLNARAIESGRLAVCEGNVLHLPYPDGCFDWVSAFETIYFWPEIDKSFAEVYRVLEKGGRFLVCNESDDPLRNEKWMKIMDRMQVYSLDEVIHLMKVAGFTRIQPHRHKNGRWITVIAEK